MTESKYNNKKVEAGGEEYLIQKFPLLEALKLKKSWLNKDLPEGIDDIKMYQTCLDTFVISPKKTINDFDNLEDLADLCMECLEYNFMGKSK